jgi:glycosyltransferase involved in cell wall biosynthesis
MHIGLYTLFFTPNQIGGIETYLRHLIKTLGQVDQTNEYTLFIGDHNQATFADISYHNFKQVNIPLQPKSASLAIRALRKFKIIPSHLADQLARHPIDVLHYPGTTIDQPEIKTPCLLTMHDIQHEYFPTFFSQEELAWRQTTYQSSAQKARRIITDSEYTRQTLIEKYNISPQKIRTIHLGISPDFQATLAPDAIKQVRQTHRLPQQFIFFPATPWPHKNHKRLFEALALLQAEYRISCPLVLSGAFGPEKERLQTLIAQSGISDSIYLLGYIPYQDLPGLYAAATALVFPSLFEGFGMPVLEAMACGCPVICSNTTSLPELVGEAAILIDPLNVAQIAEAIYNVLNFASLREAMKDKGLRQVQNFSWIRAAQQTVEVYQSVL